MIDFEAVKKDVIHAKITLLDKEGRTMEATIGTEGIGPLVDLIEALDAEQQKMNEVKLDEIFGSLDKLMDFLAKHALSRESN